MSACHSLRSHSLLDTVFGKIGDTYQAYCSTYKHTLWLPTMEAWDSLWIETLKQTVVVTDVEVTQDFHPEDTDHFEDLEHDNPLRLTAITSKIRWLTSENSSWGRATQGSFELHRTRVTVTVYITQPTSEHSVFCAKADKLHKLLTTGYIYLHWTWYHTTRRLVSGHRDCSWSDSWKQDQTCSGQVKRFNMHFNHRGYHVRQMLGWHWGFIVIKNL